MPVDFGLRLVDAILRHGKLQPVIEAGITPDMLRGTAKVAFETILRYGEMTGSRGALPTRGEIKRSLPGIQWPGRSEDAPPSMETLAFLVKKDFIQREMEKSWATVKDQVTDDPFAAMEAHMRRLNELRTATSYHSVKDIDLISGMSDKIYDYHDRVRAGGGVLGLPYPWEEYSLATQGLCPGDVVVIYGVPKSMKTWVAYKILIHAYLATQARCLVYTPEMNEEDMRVRGSALIGQVPYGWALRGFPPSRVRELEEYHATLRAVEEMEEQQRKLGQRLMLITGDLNLEAADPVAVIEDKIQAYEPRLIFLDSAYMLTSDRDHKTIAKFLTEIKKLAARTKVAFLVTSQENVQRATKAAHAGKNPGQSTASFTQAVTEICDLGIRVVKKNRGAGLGFLLSLWNVAGRKAMLEGITIYGNPGHQMDLHSMKLISYEEALETGDDTGKKETTRQPVRRRTGVSIVDRVDAWEKEADT